MTEETKLEFLTRYMNDPVIKQRYKASEQRREYCEGLWAEAQGGDVPAVEPEVVEPKPTAEPEPEDTEPDPAEDEPEADEAQGDEGEGGGAER